MKFYKKKSSCNQINLLVWSTTFNFISSQIATYWTDQKNYCTCSTLNTSHTVFFTIAHVTTAIKKQSLANKDTLHNRDSKGMVVYMDSDYIYLQEGFLFITILCFHFKQNTKYICTMFTSRSTSTVMSIIQLKSLCLYRGKYLHFSRNTKVISQNSFLTMAAIE